MERAHRRRRLRFALAGLAAIAGFAALWGFVIEPRRLVVNKVDLALPLWPEEQAPLEVALLSDLHIGSPWWDLERAAELVRVTNETKPDVILLAGDYTINGVKLGTRIDIEAIAKVLAGFRAPHGTIAVLGNHDEYNDRQRTRQALEANGIVVLENETKTFDHGGRPVSIAGYADYYVNYAWPERTFAKADPTAPVIALVHEPDVFARHYARPAITLAGHTHGGQVALPLLGRPVVPSDFGQRFAAGHVVEDGHHLFVTTGLGTSIYPVRFGVPPEIARLTLRH